MIFFLITLLVGLSISATAAYYSVIGLIAIFNASPMAIAVMGGSLEVAKVVIATWLKKYWKQAPILMKTYLVTAVMILMCITSLGIFGFLSKAHIQQSGNSKILNVEIGQLDFSIQQEQDKISSRKQILTRLDEGLKIYFDKGFVTRGLKERNNQKIEREQIENDILVSQNKIASLMQQRMSFDKELKNFEVEVGPVKYLAALVYSSEELENKEQNEKIMESSIRVIIIALIFVFDPVAILLLLASSISLQEYKKNKKEKVNGLKAPGGVIKLVEVDVNTDINKNSKELVELPVASNEQIPIKASHEDITSGDVDRILNESIDDLNSKIYSQVQYNLNGETAKVLKNLIKEKFERYIKR
jgi:hypothetical protein